MTDDQGVLVLAGTPIGRVADASPRLASELEAADVVAAEDTRRLRRLAAELGVRIRGRVVSHFDGNEQSRVPTTTTLPCVSARTCASTCRGRSR